MEFSVDSPKALVVDDDGAVARTIGKFLERRGYLVSTALDSGEAVRLLGKQFFDLVVTDMYMPGLDGLALLRQIVNQHPATATVLLTGAPTLELEQNARALQVDAFLDKGGNPAEIETAIKTALLNKTLRMATASV